MENDARPLVAVRMKPLLCILLLALCLVGTARSEESGLPVNMQSVMNLRQLPYDSLSVYAEDVDSGEVLLQWQASEARNPASTIKLLTIHWLISLQECFAKVVVFYDQVYHSYEASFALPASRSIFR